MALTVENHKVLLCSFSDCDWLSRNVVTPLNSEVVCFFKGNSSYTLSRINRHPAMRICIKLVFVRDRLHSWTSQNRHAVCPLLFRFAVFFDVELPAWNPRSVTEFADVVPFVRLTLISRWTIRKRICKTSYCVLMLAPEALVWRLSLLWSIIT